MSGALLVRNARVVTCDGASDDPRARLGVIDRGAVLVNAGRIGWLGRDDERPRALPVQEIDAGGRVVMPGLVDPHTHLVFAGSRIDELARKMAGEDYRAIAASGGGIAASVRATRAASEDELFASARARALAMRACGTTTVEVKSGYGLELEAERRSLRAARRLAREGVVDTLTTFLGAHTVPPEWREDRAGYVDEIVLRMLPAVVGEGLADACDVYLDENAFTRDEAARVLGAAKAHGLRVKAHVGQFRDLGGPELLAEIGALSGDHLEDVSEAGLRAMATAGVRAVLLPGAWRTLRQKAPDAARMRALGVRVAVATDCNPGTSACTDLPLCAALAVRDAGLTLEEAILAVTCEAADALGRDDVGRLRVGARAHLACFESDDPRVLAYALGGTRARWITLGERVFEGRDEGVADRPLW